MKIAVSGSAGIGKTSLAEALAEKMGLPLIGEMYEPFFEVSGAFNAPPRTLAETFRKICGNKRSLEERYGDFVTDRCSIDLFHLWMVKGLVTLQSETERFCDEAKRQAAGYDLVVFPPCGVLDVSASHQAEDGRLRRLNPHAMLFNQSTMIGLATLWLGSARLLFLPQLPLSVEERVAVVLRSLGCAEHKL